MSYETLRHGAMAFISDDGTHAANSDSYTVKLQGTQPDGAAQLRISSMLNGEIDETLVFESIPITQTTVATLTMQTGELPDSLTMNYKYDESSPEEIAETLGKLTGEDSQDLTPPTISMQFNASTGKITFSAQDEAGGSGVFKILYSLQSEEGEYLTYTTPVLIGTGENIWAIAMDNALNVSASIHYPNRLFLPCIKK